MAEGGFRKKLARFLKGPPKVRKEVEKQKEPTKEQVEEWTTSFTRLLLDEEGVRVFRQFMTKGETEEGELTKDLDCLCSCLEFRESAKALEIQAKEIFDTYFEVGAEKEVGSGGKAQKVETALQQGLQMDKAKNLFSDVIDQVKKRLEDGQYTNFCLQLKEKYLKGSKGSHVV